MDRTWSRATPRGSGPVARQAHRALCIIVTWIAPAGLLLVPACSRGGSTAGVGGRLVVVSTTPANNDQQRIGGLSERYESGGRGPGTVSSGAGDPGGVSYGTYQLAGNMNRPQEFLANEGSRWAAEFGGARPGTIDSSWQPGPRWYWGSFRSRSPILRRSLPRLRRPGLQASRPHFSATARLSLLPSLLSSAT